jgi:NitT/TauT family transport system substrate-binding protein
MTPRAMTRCATTQLRRAIAAMIACWCAGAAHAADSIKISYVVPTVEYGALLVGLDQGYFAAEGIDVELVQAGGGVATPALLAGDLQFTGSPSVAISAVLRGAHLKVLFVGEDHSAFQLWAQPEIKRFEDLKDQAVGIISRGDTTEIALRYILAKRNLPDDFISYTPLGTGTPRVAALLSGSFSAALIDAGEVRDMEMAGKIGKLHLLIDLHKDVHMTFGGHATSDALIASNPDLVRRTMRALLKGLATVKSSRAVTIATLVKHGSTPDAAAASYDIFAPSLSPTAIVSDADQQFELKLRAHMLGISEDKVPPPAQFFDFSFVRKAADELKEEGWTPKIAEPSR